MRGNRRFRAVGRTEIKIIAGIDECCFFRPAAADVDAASSYGGACYSANRPQVDRVTAVMERQAVAVPAGVLWVCMPSQAASLAVCIPRCKLHKPAG